MSDETKKKSEKSDAALDKIVVAMGELVPIVGKILEKQVELEERRMVIDEKDAAMGIREREAELAQTRARD